MRNHFTVKWLLLPLSLFAILYFAGYGILRSQSVEKWDRDGHEYLIFPRKPVALYYIYRPLALLDGKLTGLRFHIGPHKE